MRLFLTIFLSLFVLTLRAEDCEVSKWGADDEIGNANLITSGAQNSPLFKKFAHWSGWTASPGK